MKKTSIVKRYLCFILFLLSVALSSLGQKTDVYGYVCEQETALPINRAIVSICNQKNNILYNCITSKEGKFHLSVNCEDLSVLTLKVSCMGYKPFCCPVGNKKIFHISLEPNVFVLKDVYVKAEKISHHNDTTSYLVSGFSSANDRTIGDVLRKMPGIEVAKNGSVSYNGKSINGFLVEGVDLFDGQYNIATRNISHDLISKVLVIENYQSAKVLKGSKSEGGTVLNLSLKDKAKGRWSGNAKIGGGMPKLWEDELFAAVLSAKNQTSLTAKTNNSGKDIINENKVLNLEDVLNQDAMDESKNIMNITQEKLGNIDEKRSRNAKTYIVNINNVQKISDTAILHSKIYYTDDSNIFNCEKGESYFLNDTILTRNTHEYSKLGTKELAASLIFKNDKENSFFSDKFEYNSLWQRNQCAISGDYSNRSIICSDIHCLNNKLSWIIPVGPNHLKILSNSKYQSVPENIFMEADGVNSQYVRRHHFVSSTKIDYTWNLKRWAIAIESTGVISVSNFTSKFSSDIIDTTFYEDSNINYLKMVVRPIITYKFKGIRSEFQLPLSEYIYWGLGHAAKLFCMPKWTLSWQVNSRWKLRTNISLGSEASPINNSYAIPVMTDSKTFRSSPVVNYRQNKQNYAFAVNYTDYTHMLFGNASIAFNKGNDKSNTTKMVNRDYVIYSKTKGDNSSKGIVVLGNISKRLDGIKGMINTKCLFMSNQSAIRQNGLYVDFNTNMLQSSIGLCSTLNDWLEIDYQLSYIVNSLESSTTKSSSKLLTQELLLSVLPVKALSLTVSAEHYANYFSSYPSRHTFFCDIRCSYRYRKIDFAGSLTNVFNQNNYSQTTYNDLSSSYVKYALRQRNILLSLVAYF